MVRGKRTVRASEIGSFIYCQRAWWYQRQGFEPINRAELAAGSEFHNNHANKARAAIVLSVLGWLLAFAAVILLIALLSGRLLP
jgi:hypothetical protein